MDVIGFLKITIIKKSNKSQFKTALNNTNVYQKNANAAGKLIVDALPDIKMEQTRHNKDCRYDPL